MFLFLLDLFQDAALRFQDASRCKKMKKVVSFIQNIWFREQFMRYYIGEPCDRNDTDRFLVWEKHWLPCAESAVPQRRSRRRADSDVEMMGFLGAGNNPMVGMTVAVAVAVAESQK